MYCVEFLTHVVSTATENYFKNRLDNFWKNQYTITAMNEDAANDAL